MTNSTSSSPWPKLCPTPPSATRCGRRARRRSAAVVTVSVPVSPVVQSRYSSSVGRLLRMPPSRRRAGRWRRRVAAVAARERRARRWPTAPAPMTFFSSTPVSRRSCCAHRVVHQAGRRRPRSPGAANRATRPRARAGACRASRRDPARPVRVRQHAGETRGSRSTRGTDAAARHAPTARRSTDWTSRLPAVRRRVAVRTHAIIGTTASDMPGYCAVLRSPAAARGCRRRRVRRRAGSRARCSARGSAPDRSSARSRLCTRYELKL